MTNKEKVFKYLILLYGNLNGAIGVIGNLIGEAGAALRTNNMENYWEPRTGWNDITYTQAVNDGSYRDYRIDADGQRRLANNNPNDNARSAFSNDAIGYGLVQWTSVGRKTKMYDYIKMRCNQLGIPMDISNIELQLEYIMYEMATQYKRVYATCINSNDSFEVAKKVCMEYETPVNYNKYETWDYRHRCGISALREIFHNQTTFWFDYNGKWHYVENSMLIKDRWVKYNGDWYYIDNGTMLSNSWINYENKWYWLDKDGKMVEKEWVLDNNKYYWCGEDGIMIKNSFVEWEGDEYYLKDDGSMAQNEKLVINGNTFTFDNDGKVVVCESV